MQNRTLNPSEIIAKDIPLETIPWGEIEHVIDLFYSAFQHDPFFLYLSSTARQSEYVIRQNFRFDIETARLSGVIFRTSHEYEGASVWHLNGFTRSSFLLTISSLRMKLNQFKLHDLRKLISFYFEIERAHMYFVKQPHYYLSLFGVDPNCQGRGWGSRLIRPVLEHADKNRKICYLETETEKNVEMYRHYGFDVVKTLKPDFSDADFTLMLRKPI